MKNAFIYESFMRLKYYNIVNRCDCLAHFIIILFINQKIKVAIALNMKNIYIIIASLGFFI